MEQPQLTWIANFIWGIADDVLRDLYVRGKYRDVILPMTVLRRLDAVLDSSSNRLYYVSSHQTTTQVGRLLYSGIGWTQDMALTTVPGFGHGNSSHAVSMARANDGQLWLFRINGTALEAKVSTDDGHTWSATLVLKSGITGNNGNTAGLAFTANGNRVGVFYGMATGTGGVQYGFLHHQDGAANTAWTDETANLTFFANERGNHLINAKAAKDGRLFLVTRNGKVGAANAAQNTLYVRSTSGVWSKYKVNVGTAWKSPVVAVDETNNRVYVAGIRTTAPNFAEYKSCSFGSEATLQTQTPTLLLQHDNDNFGELTEPSHVVYGAYDLLLCGGNTTRNDVWYKQIDLGLAKNADRIERQESVAAQAGTEVSAYPNPFNPETQLAFAIPNDGRGTRLVTLAIFDVIGRQVRELVRENRIPGKYSETWNGRDDAGRLVSSGIYLYRLSADGFSGGNAFQQTRKMVLSR
jgi:hypothetical protein